MLPRVLTGLVFYAVLLLGLYGPWAWAGWIIFALVFVATLMGTHEYYNLARRLQVRPSPWPGFCIAVAFLIDAWALGFAHFPHLFITCFWLLLMTQVFFKRHDRAIVNMACSLFGSIYVGMPLAILLFLFRYPERWGFAQPWAGGNLIVFLAVTSQMTDIGGYLIGKPLGRHKMTPVLSPNKSWEGMAGGVALAVLSGILLRAFWPGMKEMISPVEAIILPLIFTLLGTIGDLAESAFKRDAGVKDSGRTYTGHGGMLDIIDSLLLCAPAFYLYLEVVRS